MLLNNYVFGRSFFSDPAAGIAQSAFADLLAALRGLERGLLVYSIQGVRERSVGGKKKTERKEKGTRSQDRK